MSPRRQATPISLVALAGMAAALGAGAGPGMAPEGQIPAKPHWRRVQSQTGREEALAAAQAKRDLKAAKRAAILARQQPPQVPAAPEPETGLESAPGGLPEALCECSPAIVLGADPVCPNCHKRHYPEFG